MANKNSILQTDKDQLNAPWLLEVIINVVIWHHSLPNFIVTNKGLLFIFKFWLLLYYFFDIKLKLSTAFYPQIDDQIKRQNSIIKVYSRVFVNFE